MWPSTQYELNSRSGKLSLTILLRISLENLRADFLESAWQNTETTIDQLRHLDGIRNQGTGHRTPGLEFLDKIPRHGSPIEHLRREWLPHGSIGMEIPRISEREAELEARIEELRQRHLELEEEIENKDRDFVVAANDAKELAAKLDQLQHNIQGFHTGNDELRRKNARIKAQNTELSQDLHHVRVTNENLERVNGRLERANGRLERANEQLNGNLRRAKNHIGHLEQQCEALDQELDTERRRVRRRDATIDRQGQEINRLSEEVHAERQISNERSNRYSSSHGKNRSRWRWG
jgi:chromosome segregation ATPase